MRKKSALGFSLVELLVVVSIIGVLASIGMASYISFNQRQTLDQMTKKIVQDLRLAQSLAFNNQKPLGLDGNEDADCIRLDGYIFSLNEGAYSIGANCFLATGNTGLVGDPIKIETIPGSPAIFSIGGVSAVKFKVLRQIVEGSGTITVTAFGRSRTISIDPGGSIIVEGETP